MRFLSEKKQQSVELRHVVQTYLERRNNIKAIAPLILKEKKSQAKQTHRSVISQRL